MAKINADALNLEERVVRTNKCQKTHKGGRTMSWNVLVVVGDRNGYVGAGIGKARAIPDAIRKGVEAAKKNVIHVPLTNTTIPHDIETEFSSARVRLMPASPGTGVIAGRGMRPVLEAAGIKDILSKSYGSNNPVNVVKAAFLALSELTSLEEQARMRGMTPHELHQRRVRRKPEAQEAS